MKRNKSNTCLCNCYIFLMYKANIPIMYCIPAVFIQMWNNSKEQREGMKLDTECHRNYAPGINKINGRQ